MSEGHPKEDARNRLGTWGGSEAGQSHHPGHHTGRNRSQECCQDHEKVQSLGKKTLPRREEDQMLPGDQAHSPGWAGKRVLNFTPTAVTREC